MTQIITILSQYNPCHVLMSRANVTCPQQQHEKEEKSGKYTSKAFISGSDSDGGEDGDDAEPVVPENQSPVKAAPISTGLLDSDSSDLDESPRK